MKLKKLLKDIPITDVKGSKEVEITGVCANSKLIAPGNLFIAKKGITTDGTRFIPEAISAGAVAVLTDFYDPTLKNITQIISTNTQEIESIIAAHYNLHPSDDLLMIGVTGTNGKTTTSYLIKHIFDQTFGPSGLIGTIEHIFGNHRYRAMHTTPDVTLNHKLLREMIHSDCTSAVMEVSSHALDQNRVENINFDVAVFTNLTPEHLDYHTSMENYCLAKSQLFKDIDPTHKKKKNFPKAAIVNIDDPYHQEMTQNCKAQLITYGIENPADLKASSIQLTPQGTKFQLSYQGNTIEVTTPLAGRFNIYNCLAAIGAGISQEIPLETIVHAASSFPPIEGRLEFIPNPLGLKIYVDFAHTPDALKNVLNCLKEFNSGRLITVFGCGGDRDQQKRPLMAKVCEQYSDLAVVTSDNPRSEDPQAIISAIIEGFNQKDSFAVEVDRRRAIEKAIHLAKPEDIILIAGKGHEPYQTFAHQTIEFDDREVARELCEPS